MDHSIATQSLPLDSVNRVARPNNIDHDWQMLTDDWFRGETVGNRHIFVLEQLDRSCTERVTRIVVW